MKSQKEIPIILKGNCVYTADLEGDCACAIPLPSITPISSSYIDYNCDYSIAETVSIMHLDEGWWFSIQPLEGKRPVVFNHMAYKVLNFFVDKQTLSSAEAYFSKCINQNIARSVMLDFISYKLLVPVE